MVGVWPTHIDFIDGPPLLKAGAKALQCIVGGVPLPAGTLPTESREPRAPERTSIPECPSRALVSCHDPASLSRGGLVTGVVFRGIIGKDRAVRADVPFPWMDSDGEFAETTVWRFLPNMQYDGEVDDDDIETTQRNTGNAAENQNGGCNSRNTNSSVDGRLVDTQRNLLRYPDAFIAHVRSSSPFATLWPGHAKNGDVIRPLVAGRSSTDGCAGSIVGNGVGGNIGSGTNNVGGAGVGGNTPGGNGDLGAFLPSSGPDPFFRTGLIAYFEITLGESMGPLNREGGGGAGGAEGGDPAGGHYEQCVTIGLATDEFSLT